MNAYPEGLRERIVNSVISGQDIHAVAERFQVSSLTVWRYLKQYREQGNLLECIPDGLQSSPPSSESSSTSTSGSIPA